MPMGSRHRETGLLLDSRRGLVLQVDGGGEWALDSGGKGRRLLGRRVTIEGVRSGYDRLDVMWIVPEGQELSRSPKTLLTLFRLVRLILPCSTRGGSEH